MAKAKNRLDIDAGLMEPLDNEREPRGREKRRASPVPASNSQNRRRVACCLTEKAKLGPALASTCWIEPYSSVQAV